MTDTVIASSVRDNRGRFVPGQTANPKGRGKGSANKSVALKKALETKLTQRLDKDALVILNKAIEMAKAGDKTMIKLLLDKLLPPLKAEDNKTSGGIGNIQIIVNPMQLKEHEPKGETYEQTE